MFALDKDRLSSTQVKMLFLGKTRLPNSLNIEFDGVIIFLSIFCQCCSVTTDRLRLTNAAKVWLHGILRSVCMSAVCLEKLCIFCLPINRTFLSAGTHRPE